MSDALASMRVRVMSPQDPIPVIPAKAGIHCRFTRASKWIPAFAGMTVLRVHAGMTVLRVHAGMTVLRVHTGMTVLRVHTGMMARRRQFWVERS